MGGVPAWVRAVLLAGIALGASTAAGDAGAALPGCSATDSYGLTVDVSQLHRSSGAGVNVKPWVGESLLTPKKYYFNVCGPVADAGTDLCKSSTAYACSVDKATSKATTFGVDSTLGLTNSQDATKGAFLSFTTTDPCPGAPSKMRLAIVQLRCGTTQENPVVLQDDGCTLIVEWTTCAACTDPDACQSSTSCATYDPSLDQAYDISALSRSDDDWLATDSEGGYEFRINVCRPLVGLEAGPESQQCKGGYGCQLKPGDASFTPNQLGTAPSFNHEVVGQYVVKSGSTCHVGKPNEKQRSMRIYLSCAAEAVGLGHPVFRNEEDCEYIFDWPTTAACPRQDVTSKEPCIVKSPAGETFDLTGLGAQSFSDRGVAYEFSLCEAISCGATSNAGACVDGQNYGLANQQVTYINGLLLLRYTNPTGCKGKPATTTIMLICDPDTGDAKEVLSRKERNGCEVVIRYTTSLACPGGRGSESLECIARDAASGKEYDLSRLRLSTGNWLSVLTTGEGAEAKTQTFNINICRDLVATADGKCTTKNSGICQIDTEAHAHSVGRPSNPEVDGNGKLVLTFEGGDPCHFPWGDVPRNASIDFTCGPSLGSPTFLGESEQGCEYLFEWRSSAACPLSTVTGSDCRVTDGVTGDVFDFRSIPTLRRSTRLSGVDGDVLISPCGRLASPAGCQGASVCFTGFDDQGKEKTVRYGNIGGSLNSGVLLLRDGTPFIDFQGGDKCGTGTEESQTHVVFECPPAQGGDSLQVTHHSKDGCSLEVVILTELACPSEPEPIPCTYEDQEGNFYDLSRLMLNKQDWSVRDGDFLYELNICRPLTQTVGTNCSRTAAACQIYPTNSGHHDKNLGKPSGPQYDETRKQLFLEYTHGTGGCPGGQERRTRIDLICPDDATDQDKLVFLDEANCEYLFSLTTMAACKVTKHVGADCTVKDPLTNKLFDLRPLRNTAGYTTQGGGFSYHVDICPPSSAQKEGATQDTGDSKKAMGLGNDELTLFDGNLALLYKLGDPCHSGQYRRATKIVFVCDPSATTADSSNLKFVEETEQCLYIFEYATSLACVTQDISCTVSDPANGQTYDLSPLRNNYRDHVVSDYPNAREFHINVCRTLVSHLGCHDGQAGCVHKTTQGATGDQDLGLPGNPALDERGHLVMSFVSGSKAGCPRGVTTTVEFACSPTEGDLGSPSFRFESMDGCHYTLDWTSSAACPVAQSTGDPATCTVTDHVLGDTYSLANLGALNSTGGGYLFFITPCLSQSALTQRGCESYGACQQLADGTRKNIGKTAAMYLVDSVVHLKYTGGDTCSSAGGASRNTTIVFICDPDHVDHGHLDFVNETSCNYYFEWRTADACSLRKTIDCTYTSEDNMHLRYDLSGLMTPSFWSTSTTKSEYSFNVCQNVIDDPDTPKNEACGSDAAVCKITGNGRIPVGKIDPKTTKLTTNAAGDIILKYASDAQCPYEEGKDYNTIIRITCPTTSSQGTEPLLLPFSEETCTLEFVWFRPEACPLNPLTTSAAPTVTPPAPLTLADCITEANVEGETIDLRNLHLSEPVQADTNLYSNYSFTIALCGTLDCGAGPSSACQRSKTNPSQVFNIGYFSEKPKLVNDQVVLRYTGGEPCSTGPRETIITLKCDRSAGLTSKPFYLGETRHCQYEFEWYTSEACGANEDDNLRCAVTSGAASYDLSRLHLPSGRWYAAGLGGTYILNVCGRVSVGQDEAFCRGSSMCSLTSEWKIGVSSSEPEVSPAGELMLRYARPPSDSSCPGSTTPAATIVFKCKHNTLGEPIVTAHSPCETLMRWETAAACNVREMATGDDCKVTDPASGASFDLRNLREANAQFNVTGPRGEVFHLAVCKALPAGVTSGVADGLGAGAGAVIQDSQGVHSAGKANSKLVYYRGNRYIQYDSGSTDGKCGGGRSTVIQFECDETAHDGTTGPVFDALGSTACSYIFLWKTVHACLPREEECVALRDGAIHDFSALKRTDRNWAVVTKKGQKEEHLYQLNVCRSLIRTAGTWVEHCQPTSGFCQTNYDETDPNSNPESWSLGTVAKPTWNAEMGKFVISYVDGDAIHCGKPRSTEVILSCGDAVEEPVFLEESTKCKYRLSWSHPAACSPSVTRPPSAAFTCKASDGHSFTTLQPADVASPFSDFETVKASPCGGMTCGEDTNSFACLKPRGEDKSISFGWDTAQIPFASESRAYILPLISTTSCKERPAEKYTISVILVCPDSLASTKEPQFSQFHCTMEIEWETPLACANVPCVVGPYDLTRLRRPGGYALAPYRLNVCGSAGGDCPASAGACVAASKKSLGAWEGVAPGLLGGVTTLTYPGGDSSTCSDPSDSAETEVQFTCKAGELGYPRFDKTDGCRSVFVWETCLVCPDETADCDASKTVAPTAPPSPSGTSPKGSNGGGGGGGGGGNAGAIVGVLLLVIVVVAVAGYILISPDRRYRVLKLLGRTQAPQYHYEKVGNTYEDSDASMLIGGSDDDDDDDDDDEILYMS